MTKKTVLITGASSGMGYAAAKLFAQRGWEVYAGACRIEKIPMVTGIHPIRLDVTDAESRQTFVQAARATPTLDVLINNAGYGEYGPLEEVSLANAHRQLETNLFGASELTKLVLPRMRAQHKGRIINISSIGGEMYSPLGGWYHVAKHGLNVWSDVLDTEIRQFGLRSVVVEPGGTQSSWSAIAMGSIKRNLKVNTPYRPMVDKTLQLVTRMGNRSQATSADLAQVFYRAATVKRPKQRYYYATSDRLLAWFSRVQPRGFHQAVTRLKTPRATK